VDGEDPPDHVQGQLRDNNRDQGER